MKWASWMSQLKAGKNQISLPKFNFSYGRPLNDVMISLGMGNAFSGQADFSRIVATGGLSITDIKQKAVVEVNEDGTTAAAATSVAIGITAAGPSYTQIDHPFIFAIRETKTGLSYSQER